MHAGYLHRVRINSKGKWHQSMCGIVCYYGHFEGITHVLEALTLLEYRAPDSTGLSVIDDHGHFSLSRSVGTAQDLVKHLQKNPLFPARDGGKGDVEDFLNRQSIPHSGDELRDCSPSTGQRADDLYHPGGLQVGLGDRGSSQYTSREDLDSQFSSKMKNILDGWELSTSPDFDQDAVRHAFRIVAANVTSQYHLNRDVQEKFDHLLQDRISPASYKNWFQAWQDEVAINIPGQAFKIAVNHFQKTYPGLAESIPQDEHGRVGELTARAMSQIVMGHGRWAMVGAVTAQNTHPFLDRSKTRAVCENGSHNANLLLETRASQEEWWRDRDESTQAPVHRSENTTEVIAFEWERAAHEIKAGSLSSPEKRFVTGLEKHDIHDREEQALRLCLQRLKRGNAHACSFHSLRHPGRLYISSHHKPIAIVRKSNPKDDHRPLMIASDVNAALMLWSGSVVDAAARELSQLKQISPSSPSEQDDRERKIRSILEQFQVEVIFLDHDAAGGTELIARIENEIRSGKVTPTIEVTKYNGAPVQVQTQKIELNPTMVGKGGYPSYTEFHISEIPEVLDRIKTRYLHDGSIHLASEQSDQGIITPGINEGVVQARFGTNLESLERILLIGEGSSWRDAQAVSPLFHSLLPEVTSAVYHPVEVLNLGENVEAGTDLVLEVSWSGTTDSILKTDGWLQEQDVLRLGITGRPQSDLGRRTSHSAGTLDVESGVEISVATVKGFQSILFTLHLIGLRLAELTGGAERIQKTHALRDHLRDSVVRAVRQVVEDQHRRDHIRDVAQRCQAFNKVAVVGDSPICIEGELKIEELAQIVACPFGFHDVSLRFLMERSAVVEEDRHRTLFLINATTSTALSKVQPVVNYLHALHVYTIIHTIESEQTRRWRQMPNTAVFTSPEVEPYFQPLIDAPFFFDFAVALAYARGLSSREVDRPRNLAKSVTTTGAEKRVRVEARQEFNNITLQEFSKGAFIQRAWDESAGRPSRQALHTNLPMHTALAVLNDPLPERLGIDPGKHLLLSTDTEATENAAHMAAAAWQELLGVDITVYRQPVENLPVSTKDARTIQLKRKGSILMVEDEKTINLPTDFSPLQLELLGSVYLIGLGVRLARQQGRDTALWEKGMAQLPFVIEGILAGQTLRKQIANDLGSYVNQGYDKAQIIGGGQDFAAAKSIARSLRTSGFMAEALYTDSAWHGPLAAVGGPGADHDALAFILATDPLFQSAAMVDTQVYRTRHAPVILIVPEGNRDIAAVQGVDASNILTLPALPRPFLPVGNAALGAVTAQVMERLWAERSF